jgi:hypothetical protein
LSNAAGGAVEDAMAFTQSASGSTAYFWVTATNVAEVAAGSHGIAVGTVVWIEVEWAVGNVPHFFFDVRPPSFTPFDGVVMLDQNTPTVNHNGVALMDNVFNWAGLYKEQRLALHLKTPCQYINGKSLLSVPLKTWAQWAVFRNQNPGPGGPIGYPIDVTFSVTLYEILKDFYVAALTWNDVAAWVLNVDYASAVTCAISGYCADIPVPGVGGQTLTVEVRDENIYRSPDGSAWPTKTVYGVLVVPTYLDLTYGPSAILNVTAADSRVTADYATGGVKP